MYAEDGSLLGEYPMEANPATAPIHGAQHIWLPTANGPMPIAVVGEGRQYAVHADHLNTPRRLTQEDGKVAWQWAYSAFGEEAPTTAATRFTSVTTNPTTGSTAVPLVQYNLRYPGQYFDEESGLHYNHFRSYDSKVGRYTQADPIELHGGFNRFGYVDGNPLSLTDPTGQYGIGGAMGGIVVNGTLQAALLHYWGGADWEQAARCIDLNKVIISSLMGLVGPTVMDGVSGRSSWSSVISAQIIGHLIKKTFPAKPLTPLGCEEDCNGMRERLKNNLPSYWRYVLENMGA